MVNAVTQHHVAVLTRLSVTCARYNRPRKHDTVASHFVIKRLQSSISKAKQHTIAQSHPINLPDECFGDTTENLVPSLSSRAIPHNASNTVDLSKTRPSPLESPPALNPKDYPTTNGTPPISERAKHLFKIGKSYLAFYKTGFKNVWYNYKQTRAIMQKIAPHTLDTAAMYGGQARSGSQIPIISRAEYQFCVRSRHDIFKLIPFSLVFAICGEFTPLVIIALGTVVVPYTCRIPQQETKDLQKKLKKDEEYMELMTTSLGASTSSSSKSSDQSSTTSLRQIPAWRQEWLEAYRYGLTAFREPLPLIGYMYHQYILHPRVVKHCNTLLYNTILIHREGGFRNLDPRSIFEWADKYSLSALHEYINTYTEKLKRQASNSSNSSDATTPTITIADLCTPDLKKALASACDKESAYILNQDWTRLKPTCHWRTTFRSLANEHDQSPDTIARRRDIQRALRKRSEPAR